MENQGKIVDSAANVMKEIKGITSFSLRNEFAPILSKLPSLWTKSYFASTSGNVSAETIQQYIEAQKGILSGCHSTRFVV